MKAVIFAGGKSSRMGRDKALLSFGGYNSLTEYQYRKLEKIFSKVYISSKENKFDFDCEIIEDIDEISSPLIALISIFEKIDEAFILSVDTPFVDKNIIDKLIQNNSDKYDVILAKSPNGLEPLCGIYRSSILKIAKAQLEDDNHRLNSLLSKLNIKVIEFEDNHKFMNLNYPLDYEEANLSVCH